MEASYSTMVSKEIVQFNQLRFRKSVLFYLKTNAEPRTSLKLMQISRFFCFKEYPYMVVNDLIYENGEWNYFQLGQRQDGYQTMDLHNLTKPLWITSELNLACIFDSNLLAHHLLLKTAVCDIKKLNIEEQSLKMSEFEFLISSKAVEDIRFVEIQIFYDDGSIVPVDEIVKLLPNLKKFAWLTFDEISLTSTTKFIEYLNPPILSECWLWAIPETFDFKLFSEFMAEYPFIYFYLAFSYNISEEYAKILRDYIHKLIETGAYKNRNILIAYPDGHLYGNAEFHNISGKYSWNI